MGSTGFIKTAKCKEIWWISIRIKSQCYKPRWSYILYIIELQIQGQIYLTSMKNIWGFPGGTLVKKLPCQCRRHKRCRFNPWVRKIPWRRKRQPVPVILPRKSHGQRSLVGYSPWGCKESDTTEHKGYQRDTFVINWYDLKFDKVVNLVPHEWKGKKK